MIFCECKWISEDVGLAIINDLVRKSQLVYSDQRYYLLFAKNGFTQTAKEFMQSNGEIQLISFHDMCAKVQHI